MTDTTEQTEQQKRRAAYSAAETRLREAHEDEFRALVTEEAQQRGVTYNFRKTAEERATDQVRALLAEHPDLLKQFQQGEPEQQVPGS